MMQRPIEMIDPHKYVTVVPIEYPRHRQQQQQQQLQQHQLQQQFIKPPDEYRDDYPQNRNWPHTRVINSEAETIRRKQLKRSIEHKLAQKHHRNEFIQTCSKQLISAPPAFQTNPIPSKKPMKVFVYTMADVVLHMDLEDSNSTTVSELVDIILKPKNLGLPKMAKNVFTIWMKSNVLEIQLKPYHKLWTLYQKWSALEDKYCNEPDKMVVQPLLWFQRNVFFPKKEEEKIKDPKIIELLYAEAKYNVLQGRYPVEVNHCLMLAIIQCRIELGSNNLQQYNSSFFRDNKERFLPAHLYKKWSSWFRLDRKSTPHSRLAEHLKRLQITGSDRKLYQKYLECSYMLPFYGCAFFPGQIEQPVRGLMSLLNHKDVPIYVAINTEGVYILDNTENCLLLGLKYQDFSWEFAKPSEGKNSHCLPCIFLQFLVLENGTRVSKIVQVFSKQAVMMDALIACFVEDFRHKLAMNDYDDVDRTGGFEHISVADGSRIPLAHLYRSEPQSRLLNKLNKLTLATFDEDGMDVEYHRLANNFASHCIGQTGSWSFSY
ncbi:putative FERM domain-containing protein FRMD8P1 isoform X2 [Adelges cooleyi]|uniref:putative FERM domain-containing protein FRMD8P1 isoform X2 n=1 Tax=Adelges cooleyi TaxID=133065 RepID=UPI002180480E|nr:putative FERM domain-containing protein FRMD8P1 isoform X2 [Adelges cooleyi]